MKSGTRVQVDPSVLLVGGLEGEACTMPKGLTGEKARMMRKLGRRRVRVWFPPSELAKKGKIFGQRDFGLSFWISRKMVTEIE